VVVRILRAILTECPDGTDQDIAEAAYVRRDQNSPGLWVHTMPGCVRELVLRRNGYPGTAHITEPKCWVCGNALGNGGSIDGAHFECYEEASAKKGVASEMPESIRETEETA
jgi:hypothetical protein